jgi:hypothetical protein
MTRDAAHRLRGLVASGHEIPYDVQEPGSGSPLPRYLPLTERFIGEHAPMLRALDSFGSACAAIESAGLASPYLEELGISVPPDPRQRGELAGIAFLCRLWTDSTDFSMNTDRLAAAIAELEAGGDATHDEIEVVVPLRGLQMPVVRLELAAVTVVRADTVEVPAEAKASEGAGVAGWESIFLGAARVSAGGAGPGGGEDTPDAGARAVEGFRQLIRTLRLFKAGGVGLGPYAWTRSGAHRWRRIATGAGRPRPGGYLLAEDELGELTAFSRALAARSVAWRSQNDGTGTALARAISRFEAGLERSLMLEALNDYLLALRFLLDGAGPADLGLAMRVAALCAEPEHRGETKVVVDRALALERELWSGDPAPAPGDAPPPAVTATEIEDLTRAILRDAACGHLGADLRSTADEILLADGLAAGEGRAAQRGGTEEWDLPAYEHEPDGDLVPEALEPVQPYDDLVPEALEPVEPDEGPIREPREAVQPDEHRIPEPLEAVQGGLWGRFPDSSHHGEEVGERDGQMQVPETPGRITIESRPPIEEENVFRSAQTRYEEPPTMTMAHEPIHGRLDAALEAHREQRRGQADRVAYLFPRPETTEWEVSELSYDRRNPAGVESELHTS